jgi:hypothetical protein
VDAGGMLRRLVAPGTRDLDVDLWRNLRVPRERCERRASRVIHTRDTFRTNDRRRL